MSSDIRELNGAGGRLCPDVFQQQIKAELASRLAERFSERVIGAADLPAARGRGPRVLSSPVRGTRVSFAAATALFVAVFLAGCGTSPATTVAPHSAAAPQALDMRTLHGSVVRMGSLRGEPLYGVRLRAFVCSRSSAEADRTVPTSFRIAHYVTSGRAAIDWGKPFRALDNDLYWLVSLGETRGACGYVDFEDVIPPENYGGVESPLGALGYSRTHRCYGVWLTLWAVLESADHTTSKPISASKRAIILCGRFRPR